MKIDDGSRSVLEQLQTWYLSECNGDWEHSYGIKIDTLDNPGWTVSIDLFETDWSDLKVERHRVERSDTDWVQSEVTESRFLGCGGPMNLGEIIEDFFRILERNPRSER